MATEDARALVSIVIPCYNGEKYLAAALESAARQFYRKLEIIVVDDGSTDHSAAVAETFKDARVRVVRQENRGLSAARNRGIAESQGRYIVFLDADDTILPRMLTDHVDFLESHPASAAVAGDCERVTDMGVPFRRAERPAGPVELSALCVRNAYPVHALTVRRAAIDAAGAFDESLRAAEDWDLWLRMLLAGLRIEHLPGIVAHYRTFPGTMSSDPEKQTAALLAVIEKTFGAPAFPPALAHLKREAAFEAECSGAIKALLRGDRAAAATLFRHAAAARKADFAEFASRAVYASRMPMQQAREEYLDAFLDAAGNVVEVGEAERRHARFLLEREAISELLERRRRSAAVPRVLRLLAKEPKRTLAAYGNEIARRLGI